MSTNDGGISEPEESLFVDDDNEPLYHGRNENQTDQPVLENTDGSQGHHPQVTLSLPLKFQQIITNDVLSNDCLVILGRGLGLSSLIANLVHALDTVGSASSSNSIVLIVGANEEENLQLKSEMRELSVMNRFCQTHKGKEEEHIPPCRGLTIVNTDQVSVYNRERLYKRGGTFSVTSRILVVDMLARTIECDKITGVVVLHGDRINSTSNEAFILRILRQHNKSAFIKAFSDEPERIATGFNPLSTTLKNLQLSKVQLWPRFHVQVTEDLALSQLRKRHVDVIEMEIEMTNRMKQIQSAIMDCVEACISHIRKTNPQIDTIDWTLDNALKHDFVAMIHAQLDPVWHRISWRTRQLVSDLTTLRQIINALPILDSVGFYQMLETILLANSQKSGFNSERSPWLAMDAAHTLFTISRERVFGDYKPSDMKPSNFIEELPKWNHLLRLLDEISAEKLHGNSSKGPILIMCNEKRTSRQVQQLISQRGTMQGQEYLKKLFIEYKDWRKRFINVRSEFAKSSSHENSSSSTSGSFSRSVTESSNDTRRNPNKRRRVRGGSILAHSSRVSSTIIDVEELIELDNYDNDLKSSITDSGVVTSRSLQQDADVTISDVTETSFYDILEMTDLILVQNYDNRKDDNLLDQIMPSHIIMYEPDPAFIRRIEIYKASHPQQDVKNYFFYYAESIEEQRYLADVRREKDAFTKLIREKASMPITLRTKEDNSRPISTILTNVTSRVAGGGMRTFQEKASRVVIDMREFRSSLPSLLHEQNFELVPVVLTVGDYILTPEICIERKSVPDLISSFRDGRLYTQCEAMFRYYKHPTLLIEFDESKSFSFEPFSDTPSGAVSASTAKMMQENVQQKLALLLLTFPKLKVLWSSSPLQSVEIFAELKRSQDEPNVDSSVLYGQDDTLNSEKMGNYFAIDMLQSIPGVTIRNYHLLIGKVKNLHTLCLMPEEEIAKIVGNEAARKISRFLNRNLGDKYNT